MATPNGIIIRIIRLVGCTSAFWIVEPTGTGLRPVDGLLADSNRCLSRDHAFTKFNCRLHGSMRQNGERLGAYGRLLTRGSRMTGCLPRNGPSPPPRAQRVLGPEEEPIPPLFDLRDRQSMSPSSGLGTSRPSQCSGPGQLGAWPSSVAGSRTTPLPWQSTLLPRSNHGFSVGSIWRGAGYSPRR